jgi:predicted RNA-binding protein with RPS1 domain
VTAVLRPPDVGTKVLGTVRSIREGVGVFVEVDDGPTCFMHISQLATERVEQISDRLKIGDRITAIVKPGKWPNERQLTMRGLDLPELPAHGTDVEGTVKTILDYGAFVSVQGHDLLLANPEIAHEYVQNARDYLKEGDQVRVKLIPGRPPYKYALSRKALLPAPPPPVLNEGTLVTGTVVELWVHGDGATVQIESRRQGDGVLVALDRPLAMPIHVSEISDDQYVSHIGERLQPDGKFEGRVVRSREGRLELSLKPFPAGWMLGRFAVLGNNFIEELKRLAAMTQEENEHWDYVENKTGGVPILESYVKYTFAKVQADGQIKIKGERAALNTGLMTETYSAIFALFTHVSPDARGKQWLFRGFYDQGAWELADFRDDLPMPGNYFEGGYHHLVYDWRLKLEPVLSHIIQDRRSRLPSEIRDGDAAFVTRHLQAAVDQAIDRVKLNYKTAIPQWYKGRLRLLLPLRLTKDQRRTDLALTVSREKSPGDGPDFYRGNTVLPLDWAYIYARLVARPDPEWLVPLAPSGEPDEG